MIDHGEIVEFDEPYDLLQIPSGYFRKLVNEAGEDGAKSLELLAKETKELRKSDSVKQNGHYPKSNTSTLGPTNGLVQKTDSAENGFVCQFPERTTKETSFSISRSFNIIGFVLKIVLI